MLGPSLITVKAPAAKGYFQVLQWPLYCQHQAFSPGVAAERWRLSRQPVPWRHCRRAALSPFQVLVELFFDVVVWLAGAV